MPQPNFVQNINELSARVRVLESKANLLKNDVSISNTNLLEESRKINSKIKIIEQEIKDVKQEMTKIKDTMKHMIEEISEFAKKNDLKILEKYINMWNPLKYVTESEVRQITKEQLKELLDMQTENAR